MKMNFSRCLAGVAALCLSAVLYGEEVVLKEFGKEISCYAQKKGVVKFTKIEKGIQCNFIDVPGNRGDVTTVQLSCIYPAGLQEEVSYKITATVKSTTDCKFSAALIGHKSPWPYYVQKWFSLKANQERKITISFTPEANTGIVRTPCFMLGEVPKGSIFTVSDVKLFQIR